MSSQPTTPQASNRPPPPPVLASVTPIGASAPLAHAAATLDRASAEIEGLWTTALRSSEVSDLDRLARVSHLLRRAARLLDDEHDIG